jgi:hypothetical protein
MTSSNTATPVANRSVVARTREEYMELRRDKGRPLLMGPVEMRLDDLYACYDVTDDEYGRIIQEGYMFVVSRPDILDATRTGHGNGSKWKDAQDDIKRFITTASSWNKSHLFGASNITVPEEVKADALHRIVADVRREIRRPALLSQPVPSDQTEQDAGSTTPSFTLQPLPADPAGVYGTANFPPQEMPPVDNLRHISILLLNGDGGTIAEMGAGFVCNPVTWADPTLQIKWMDFRFKRLLNIAAQFSGIERNNLCLHYHEYHVINQGCLEAAVHGFSNGFRTNTAIEFTVAPIARCLKKRKRCSSLSVANSADKLFRLYCCDQLIRRRVTTGGRWFMNGRPVVIS